MGEAAGDIINGLVCEQCGVFVDGDEPGYPRKCGACRASHRFPGKRRVRQTRPTSDGKPREDER